MLKPGKTVGEEIEVAQEDIEWAGTKEMIKVMIKIGGSEVTKKEVGGALSDLTAELTLACSSIPAFAPRQAP